MSSGFVLDCRNFSEILNASEVEPSTDDPIFLLGIVAVIIASVGSSLGIILQKRAHNAEAAKPEDQKSYVFVGLPLNFQWTIGFILFAFWPLPLEFLAYTVSPQSLIVPFGGLTILFNQLLAPLLLPEFITRTEVGAAVLIFVGLILLTVGVGGNSNPNYDDPCEILRRYVDPLIVVIAIALVGVIVACYVAIYRFKIFKMLHPLCFALMAAGTNTFLQTIYKATALMAQYDLTSGGNSFNTVYPYFHIIVCFALALTVASFVNKGLARYDTIVFQPLYICTLILVSSSVGAVFYEEYVAYAAYNFILWFVGLAVIVLGIYVLTEYGTHVATKKVSSLQEQIGDADLVSGKES